MEEIIISNYQEKEKHISIDYLRSFLMLLVIMHHTFLAYTPWGYGALINDPNNFLAFEKITLYFDSFFMSLFFFISGLFSLRSIEKKGVKRFLSDRFIRLMLPFTIGILVINVIGYYISWMAYFKETLSFSSFFEYTLYSIGKIPAGPLWFLWVLYVYDVAIALMYKLKKNWCEDIRNSKNKFFAHTGRFLIVFTLFAFIAYSIFAQQGNLGFVLLFSPFIVQISRVGLYFLFFLTGAMIGVYGIERSTISKENEITKYCWIFILISILTTIIIYTALNNISKLYETNFVPGILITIGLRMIFVVMCSSACFGFIGLFNKIAMSKNKFCDLIAENAMGIYVVHYSVVTTFQYLLLKVDISGLLKAIIVVASSFFVSLGLVMLLKRIPFLRLSVGARYVGSNRKTLIIIISILLILIIFLNAV